MKILYSQIKQFVPDLSASAKEVGDVLTYTGFMMDSLTEVNFQDKKDYLIGLEIRQNRPDCLSVIGLAREVAAYYSLKVKLPETQPFQPTQDQLDIEVEATDYVKRILAIKVSGITNTESPVWLKDFLNFYDMNSINLLVDLSNYVMFVTGYTSHLIDFDKVQGKLYWSLNNQFDVATTLDASTIKLNKDKELIIRDDKNLIALAGIVGCRTAAIDLSTKTIVAEVALYNRAIIRQNSRSLNVVTEASHRLEKDLDPNGANYALNMLISMIIKYAQGSVSSALFDYYPTVYSSPKISMSSEQPSKYAGVEISPARVKDILQNLNFDLDIQGDIINATPPTYRQDVTQMEDLVEEVIRIFGYQQIPNNEVPASTVVKDITPKNILLAEKVRDFLVSEGYDETLSWPLTKTSDNQQFNYNDNTEIITQNSVNELFPALRQSMISGLFNQLLEYRKKALTKIQIFEIGKIFSQKENQYLENESLGIIFQSTNKELSEFKNHVEKLLRGLGLSNISYKNTSQLPSIANSFSCWQIMSSDEKIGIVYKLRPDESKTHVYAAEIDLGIFTQQISQSSNPVVELTQKLIELDANVELPNEQSIYDYLQPIKNQIASDYLWSMEIVDVYQLENKKRYTIKTTYKELSDQEAKEKHLKYFGL